MTCFQNTFISYKVIGVIKIGPQHTLDSIKMPLLETRNYLFLLNEKQVVFDVKCTLDRKIVDGGL